MARINFEEFGLITDLKGEHTEKVNVKEVVADSIYKGANGVKALDLALKIYKSEGETEYTDDETELLTETVERNFTAMFIRSYRNAVGKEG